MIYCHLGVISRRVKALVSSKNESSQARDCYVGGPQESRPALDRRVEPRQAGVRGAALWRFRPPRPIHPTISESPYHGPGLDGGRAVFCGRNDQWSPGLGSLGGTIAGGGSTVTVCVTRVYHSSREREDEVRGRAEQSLTLLGQAPKKAINTLIIRGGPSRRRPYDILRSERGLPPLPHTFVTEEVLRGQIWGQIPPLHSVTLRLAS